MAGIKRYDEGGYGLSNMEEAADGSWVDYDSHLMVVMGQEQMLNDKISELQKKLDTMRADFVDEAITALTESGAQSFGDCIVALNQLRADADKGGSDD
ncbi:hypothetical protein F3J38_00285 [Pantoea sp. Acro-805]|uniref:Uncharacterized protein n=1 Tax=Candidatus Pantoea formicae TaxID=2608355 RepID=A0ABX0QNI9_9GAMM|nr:hypothetical protein [Pantoea formicae]NIE98511.1 hypothetical protein [Pantoea formicae]